MTTAAQEVVRFVPAQRSDYGQDDIDVIGPVLYRMAQENGGITTDQVYSAVLADRRHPLRPYYQWDGAAAIREVNKARTLSMIRSVNVVFEVRRGGRQVEERVRALHYVEVQDRTQRPGETEDTSLPDPEVARPRQRPPTRKVFATIRAIAEDEELEGQVLERAAQELRAVQAKYDKYVRLFPGFRRKFRRVFDAIRNLA